MGPCDDTTTAADGKGCQHRHRRLASSALFLRLLSQFNRCRVAIDGVGPGHPSSKSLGGTAGPSLLPRASFGIERALLALERGVIFFFSSEKVLLEDTFRFVSPIRRTLTNSPSLALLFPLSFFPLPAVQGNTLQLSSLARLQRSSRPCRV